MRALIFSIFLFFTVQISYAQSDTWSCGIINDTSESPYMEPIGTQGLNVVVAFFDFPDGRLSNGQIPTEDWQLDLNYVPNPDAVFNYGYLSNDGVNFNRKARKLTYDQFWNIYFSENYYVTDEVHPDWMSHGRFGWPPLDAAKAYGSLKDYYKEVSYNHLIIQPYLTHSTNSGIYSTGIINKIDQDAFGNKYVRPIMMNNAKGSYYHLPSDCTNEAYYYIPALFEDSKNRLQQAFNLGEIEFNPANFNGKIIMVFAGGTGCVGGIAEMPGKYALCRERRNPNEYKNPNDPVLKYAVINGIAIACHEFGHTFGWKHTANGNYDIMNGRGKEMQNCPPHPNMINKLHAGWVPENRIWKIRTISDIQDLPPSELYGDCAVMAIYGKPGFDNNWINHSEYYVIENRRMYARTDLTVKFDKKLVWQTDIGTPPNFNGGCLITLKTAFKTYVFQDNESTDQKIINADPYRSWNLIADNGDSKDFFGVDVAGNQHFDILQETRTSSTFNLPTGISVSNIAGGPYPLYNLNFHTGYSIEEPPDYNYVFYKEMNPLPNPVVLSGNVFYPFNDIMVWNRDIYITPGSVVDFTNQGIITTMNANLFAEGTEANRIMLRGCGYGPYRLNFNGIKVGNRPANSLPTKIQFCDFYNLSSNIPIDAYTTNLDANVPFLITDNNFENVNYVTKLRSLSGNFLLQGYERNNCNLEVDIAGYDLRIMNKLEILPNRTVTFLTSPFTTHVYFDNGAMLDIKGGIIAQRSSASSKIIFDKSPAAANWHGIDIWGGYGNFKYCDFKNSYFPISINSPSKESNIEYCNFENNISSDITLNNFTEITRYPNLIQHNTFSGTNGHYASIVCNYGTDVEILNNVFNNIWNIGIFPGYVTNLKIIENVFYASTDPQAFPFTGIYAYSSGGQISCNYTTNFAYGLSLTNSSPKLFNNDITNNAIGLWLYNASWPQMTPSFSESSTLYDGGYNYIYNNLMEEIRCDNTDWVPISFPVMDNGYNSIYHEGLNDCLLNLGIALQSEYFITNNYWGVNGPYGRICPSEQNVYYSPHLTVIPSQNNCYPIMQAANNNMSQEVLLLGNANIDFYNGIYNSSQNKYRQLISLVNNPFKSYLPVAKLFYATAKDSMGNFAVLESYYNTLSQQLNNNPMFSYTALSYSTASDVEQLSLQEAIDEYQDIIDTTQNPVMRFYAYIDQLHTITLMNDSGAGNGAGSKPLNNMSNNEINDLLNKVISIKPVLNDRNVINKFNSFENKKAQVSTNISIIDNITKTKAIENVRKIMDLDKVDVSNMQLNNKIDLFNKVINYKLWEFSVLNSTCTMRPINRIEYTRNKTHINNNEIPKVFKLHQNYPNPFNPSSTIKFDLPKDINVVIKVYDILGKEVKTLVSEFKKAGFYEIEFNGKNLASGVYIYRIEAGNFVNVKKMVLLK